jgi:hypothetical protein
MARARARLPAAGERPVSGTDAGWVGADGTRSLPGAPAGPGLLRESSLAAVIAG